MPDTYLAPLVHPLLSELDAEIALTRRVLERLPEVEFAWQPHPKSMTLAKLASHTVDLVGWIKGTFLTTDFNLDDFPALVPFLAETRPELLAQLATNGQAAHDTLAAAAADDFAQSWTLRRGEYVIAPPQPRAVVVRHLISHMIHHRAQLLVYLRLLNVPVPGVYGPSADEQ